MPIKSIHKLEGDLDRLIRRYEKIPDRDVCILVERLRCLRKEFGVLDLPETEKYLWFADRLFKVIQKVCELIEKNWPPDWPLP